MNNIVEDMRDGRWIRVESITSGGNLKGRVVNLSRTGRMMGDRKKYTYIHPANTRQVRRPEILETLEKYGTLMKGLKNGK